MADKPFRVLLDLTDLHIETMKYVWMNVSPRELKTIADFKTYVLHKINLEKVDIRLFVRDGLLLDEETVIVLREDDTVKVQYEASCRKYTDDVVKESKKISSKRNYSESHHEASLNHKKCKTDSKILPEGSEESNFDEMGNKKKHKSYSMCLENIVDQSKNVNTHNGVKSQKKKDKQIASLKRNYRDFNSEGECDYFILSSNQDNTFENINYVPGPDINVETNSSLKLDLAKDSSPKNNLPFEQKSELKSNKPFNINEKIEKKSEGLGNNCPKKKRKRRKKRKEVLQTDVMDVPDNINANSEFKSFTDETGESIQRKHVVYSSPYKEEEIMQLRYDGINEGIKIIPPADTFALNKSESVVSVEPSNNYPKISTPFESDYKNPSWRFSQVQKTDLNISNNQSLGFKKEYNKSLHNKSAVELNTSFQSPKKESPLKLQYTDLPPLNSRPDIGTHIAYKILELDENYSPVISDYREGVIKGIDLESEEMEIELLKHEIKPGRTGKFENLREDEIPLPEVKTCDIVKWSALVEPKLLIY